jgi:aryl-alcohol dehydrogenase-like predicted oxidoreductase
MNYRRLGRSGLKVSELSFGSWVTYGNQVDTRAARELMAAAFDAGVNFFDNAEIYARGQSEEIMGEVLKELGWPRLKYVVSTKFYWGLARARALSERAQHAQPQVPAAGDRRLAQAAAARLRRPGVLPPSRPGHADRGDGLGDARHDRARQGAVLGHQRVERRRDPRRLGDRRSRNLHKPVMEQPQYNLLHRKRVEKEYARLYEDIGLGLTTWSPLASGLLSGKYRNGVPAGSRGALETYAFLRESLTDPQKNRIVGELETVAQQVGATLAQLALAWCLMNRHVSTVITGATRVEQVAENMKALAVAAKLTPDLMLKIEGIVGSHAS